MSGPPPVDAVALRRALSQYPTGVSVIATRVGADLHAMTAGSFGSVSLDPPLVLFCVGQAARTAALLAEREHFSINVLRADQAALSTYFAGGWKEPVPPPFRFVPFGGGVRLEGALLSLACRRDAMHPAGDHWIVLGRVEEVHLGVEPRLPLLFFDRSYRGVASAAASPAPEFPDVPVQLFYDAWDP